MFSKQQLHQFFRELFAECGHLKLYKTPIEAITSDWVETDHDLKDIAAIAQIEYHRMQYDNITDPDERQVWEDSSNLLAELQESRRYETNG